MKNFYHTAALVTVFSACEHCLGFLYRIILSRMLGAEGLGIYQTAIAVYAVFVTAASSGLPVTLSRTIAKHRTAGNPEGEQAASSAALLLSLLVSLPLTVLLFLVREPFSHIFSDSRCTDLFYVLLPVLSLNALYAVFRGYFWGNKRFLAYSLIELIEKIVSIVCGVLLLLYAGSGIADTNKLAFALVLSYFASFTIASAHFIRTGGKLRSPKGELLPLFRSSLPVTAMRTSSSLIGSLISVLFPMRLMTAGATAAQAMSCYGVVYGMVMPVLYIPSNLVGSIALVLVPELSECYYRKDKKALSGYITKAVNAALLIAGALIPFFIVCGENVGVMLFASAESGILIARSALILLPMSVGMISTSMLNSMGCEKQTLGIFLVGSASMLACVWFLPPLIGSGALIVGMACDHTVCALLSLVLLAKKAGKIGSLSYLFKLTAAALAVILPCLLLRSFLVTYLGYFPVLVITFLAVAVGELAIFSALKLLNVKDLLSRFFGGKKQKNSPSILTTARK